jgi:hypothetical protein
MNERWAKAIEDAEEKSGGTVGLMMQGMMGSGDGESPLGQARKARRDLDKSAEETLKGILKSEQFAKLPPKPPANPNPWADMMPVEEGE